MNIAQKWEQWQQQLKAAQQRDWGNTHLHRGEYRAAVASLTRALALNSDDADSFVDRGRAYVALGELDLAIADFDAALRLNRQQPAVYVDRGLAYAAKGDSAEALANFNLALYAESRWRKQINTPPQLKATILKLIEQTHP